MKMVMTVSVERQAFIANAAGVIVPKARLVLKRAGSEFWPAWENDRPDFSRDHRFACGFSTCQIRSRISPCRVESLRGHLFGTEARLEEYITRAGENLNLSYLAVAPERALSYPYRGRRRNMGRIPKEICSVLCRIAGTIIRIQIPHCEIAKCVYDGVVGQTEKLCQLGDNYNGKYVEMCKIIAPYYKPLIGVTKHGTIEFRMFGATSSLERIACRSAGGRNLSN